MLLPTSLHFYFPSLPKVPFIPLKASLEMQLDFSTRRAQVSWDDEKRIFLCCLYKFFEKDSSAFEEIFSAKYKRDLENSGFTDGRTSHRTLHTQWWDMKRHGDPIWGKVHRSPLNQGDWLPIKEMIIDVAQFLGISLVEKDKDDIDTSKYRSRTPRPVRISALTLSSVSYTMNVRGKSTKHG